MVRSVVRKECLLSNLKKKSVPPPPSFKKRSNGMKNKSVTQLLKLTVVKEEVSDKDWEEEEAINEYVTRSSKRKCNVMFGKAEMRPMVNKSSHGMNIATRWSSARYEQAQENILKIMKKEGAVFGHPISRALLRNAARKFIGDTGLLDHLLKHIDGKVALGGCERFRRWHNSNGKMEYWLESADLLDIRKEAGIQDPFWMPPPGWKLGCSPSDSSDVAIELKILREELDMMKRNFQMLVSEKADEDLANHTPDSSVSNDGVNSNSCLSYLQSELANWKEKIKEQLSEISGSLGSVQVAWVNLEKWKDKIEQKLLDLSISVCTVQTSRRPNTLTPSVPDNWDFFSNYDLVGTQSNDIASWLGAGELIDLQHTDYASIPWMEGLDFIKVEPDMSPQDPDPVPVSVPISKPDHSFSENQANHRDLKIVKEEMSKMKRKLQDVLSKKDDNGEANTKCDSSVMDNSNVDLKKSILMLQELYKDVLKMKADIKQQVKDISVSLHGSEVSKQKVIE